MRDKTSRTLRDTLTSRAQFFQIAVIGALFALGLNLIASDVFATLENRHWIILKHAIHHQSLAVGIAVVALCFMVLASVVIRSRKLGGECDAFIIFDTKTKRCVPVVGYGFSRELRRAIDAVFLENRAIKNTWETDPLVAAHQEHSVKQPISPAPESTPKAEFITITKIESGKVVPAPASAAILREAVEFAVIDHLSTHLSSYFTEHGDDKYITEYRRDDVPKLLLENRFLSILSNPIENREPFLAMHPSQSNGEVYMVMGSDGSLFSRFELILPRGTAISRPEPGTLVLANNRLVTAIRIAYDGFHTNLPNGFVRRYAKADADRCAILKIKIEIEGVVRIRALLRPSGWTYYQWFDSFLESLNTFASKDAFLTRIGWTKISALLHCMPSRDKSNPKTLPDSAAPPPAKNPTG